VPTQPAVPWPRGAVPGRRGVRQFLDIGTGIPSANNTHQVAQPVTPEAKVVYVDNDPIVLSHARPTEGHHRAHALHRRRRPRHREDPGGGAGDARLPRAGRRHADRAAALHSRRTRPARAGADPDGGGPSGSYLAISHPYEENHPSDETGQRQSEAAEMLSKAMVTLRVREEVAPFFAGLELVGPGAVPIQERRPDSEPRPLGRRLAIRHYHLQYVMTIFACALSRYGRGDVVVMYGKWSSCVASHRGPVSGVGFSALWRSLEAATTAFAATAQPPAA